MIAMGDKAPCKWRRVGGESGQGKQGSGQGAMALADVRYDGGTTLNSYMKNAARGLVGSGAGYDQARCPVY